MDELGTIKHNYDTPRIDSNHRSAAKAKAEGKVYPVKPQHGEFAVNTNWSTCFGGADYAERRK